MIVVLILGSLAMLFVAQGAPDLALTQFAVETLSIVVFLVLLYRYLDAKDDGRLDDGIDLQRLAAGDVRLAGDRQQVDRLHQSRPARVLVVTANGSMGSVM